MGKKNGERGMGDGEKGNGKEKWEWRISKRDDFVNSTKGKWEWGVSKRVKGNENGQKGNVDGEWGKGSCEMGKGEN